MEDKLRSSSNHCFLFFMFRPAGVLSLPRRMLRDWGAQSLALIVIALDVQNARLYNGVSLIYIDALRKLSALV